MDSLIAVVGSLLGVSVGSGLAALEVRRAAIREAYETAMTTWLTSLPRRRP